MKKQPQWRLVTENRLDEHRENRWVLRARAQKYEPATPGDAIQTREEELDADTRHRERLDLATKIERVLRSLSPQHRAIIGAGFLQTRSVQREVDGDRGNAKASKGDGEGAYARLERHVGKRVLVAAMTPTARAEATKMNRDPLGWLSWSAGLRGKGEVEGGCDKDAITRRDRLLAKVASEADAMILEALRPCADGLMDAKLITRVSTEPEPEEKVEKVREARPPRFKMPGWAREIRDAVTA